MQRLLRLAVNRRGEKGSWDLDELEAEFNELIIADAPIEISGLGADEVEQLINEVYEDGQEAVDVVPTAGSAIARPGDLFRLGAHGLICGDASDPAVIRRLMENDVARFVFTHEPFDVAFGGEVTGCKSGQMTESQFVDFNRKWLDAVLPSRHLHRLARPADRPRVRDGFGPAHLTKSETPGRIRVAGRVRGLFRGACAAERK